MVEIFVCGFCFDCVCAVCAVWQGKSVGWSILRLESRFIFTEDSAKPVCVCVLSSAGQWGDSFEMWMIDRFHPLAR